MKKVLSRFLIFVLLILCGLLLVAGTIFILKHMDEIPEIKDSAKGIEIFPSRKTTVSDYSRIDNESLSSYNSQDGSLCKKGYNALTDNNERYLYEKLGECVYRVSDEVDERGRYKTEMVEVTGAELETRSINTTINAFLYDNPQIFWVDNYFGYYTENNTTYVECYSTLSGNQCELYIKKLNDRIEEFLSVISEDDGKYEREMKLHDKLLQECSYNREVQSLEDGWQYFSAYGALVEGEAVCEGYSKAMMILLNLSGVEATTIRGVGENERHMWNLVELGGSWYHLDCTWDDGDDGYMHDFFNMTDTMISRDHVTDPLLSDSTYTDDFSYNFFVPECSSIDMNYFNIEGLIVTEITLETEEQIANLIYNKASAGENNISFMVDGDLSYDEFTSYLLDNSAYKFMVLAERANDYLDDAHKLKTNTCKTYKSESRQTLRIEMYFEQ